jgi:hypothetical protein
MKGLKERRRGGEEEGGRGQRAGAVEVGGQQAAGWRELLRSIIFFAFCRPSITTFFNLDMGGLGRNSSGTEEATRGW